MVPDCWIFFTLRKKANQHISKKHLKTTLKKQNKKTNQGSGVDAAPLQTGRSDLSRLSPRVSTASFSLGPISQTHLPHYSYIICKAFSLKTNKKPTCTSSILYKSIIQNKAFHRVEYSCRVLSVNVCFHVCV